MSEPSDQGDLAPLIALCRQGRLFEVQEWIRQGKPVSVPGQRSRGRRHGPLRTAIDAGFHSLVQVLLEAGAPLQEGSYVALEHAVTSRRPDLAALLMRHGASVEDVSMRHVVDLWNTEMVELFVSNGACLVRERPVAWGLIHKIRPALGLLKRHGEAQPELMQQADIALRFHAGEGNSKWVALTLWAGADPWARGPDRLDDDYDEDDAGYLNAVELALIRGHLDVLEQKKLLAVPEPDQPERMGLVEQACHAPDSKALARLLELGHRPGLLADRGTQAITWLLHSLSWSVSLVGSNLWFEDGSRRGIDSSRSRERMKMLHMFVANGGKWLPPDKRAVADVRRSLLKMAPSYVLEFTWLMQEYGAARRRDVHELLRTQAMVRLLSKDRERAAELLAAVPEEVSEVELGRVGSTGEERVGGA